MTMHILGLGKKTEYLIEEELNWKNFILIQAWVLEELNLPFRAERATCDYIGRSKESFLSIHGWQWMSVLPIPHRQAPFQ